MEGKAYFDLVEEFVRAVQKKYPRALLQFEDFLTPNAYALLNKYRDRVLCFNDDIQGTAAVALAGVYASTRITGLKFADLRIMFLGAGSAATGIADLMASALVDEGLSLDEARRRLWFVDVNGLVVKGRTDLMAHNLPYAHEHAPLGFVEAIDALKPHVLIGATGAPGTFTQQAVERMCAHNERPVLFALSNPTSKAECTAEQAYTLEPRPSRLRERQPLRRRDVRGPGVPARPGQQRLRVSGHRSGRGRVPALASFRTSSSWPRPERSPGWWRRRTSSAARSIRRCGTFAGSRSPSP